MEVVCVILGFMMGVMIGVVALDWRARRQAMAAIEAERQEMAKAVAAVSTTINPLVLTVQQMQERLGAQEMRAAQMNRPR